MLFFTLLTVRKINMLRFIFAYFNIQELIIVSRSLLVYVSISVYVKMRTFNVISVEAVSIYFSLLQQIVFMIVKVVIEDAGIRRMVIMINVILMIMKC